MREQGSGLPIKTARHSNLIMELINLPLSEEKQISDEESKLKFNPH